MNLFVSAGEASGDRSAADLLAAARRRQPDLTAWGVGGRWLREAGAELLYDSRRWGAIGVVEALRLVPGLLAVQARLKATIRRRRPDALVLVDFGAFNVPLGRWAKAEGFPVFYYFPPGSWRKRPSPAYSARMAGAATRIATPFPWSEEVLRAGGCDAHFVGHPLLDVVRPSRSKGEFCARHGLDPDGPLVGLLPGSRRQEVAHAFPALLATAERIRAAVPGAQFAVPLAPTVDPASLRCGGAVGMAVVPGEAYNVMAHADLLLVVSGTATLEATITGTPMVIFYRGSRLTEWEYRLRRPQFDFFGMPNILAGREVCPERLQGDATPEELSRLAIELLTSTERRETMQRELGIVRQQLGEPGGADRAASLLLEMIRP